MADHVGNPFQNVDIYVPKAYHAEVSGYSRRSAKDGPDHAPFGRMVDFWFFALCVGARQSLEPAELGPNPVKVIDGSIFGAEGWRVHLLMLIAIGSTGDVDIVSRPREMMRLASGLAAAGIPIVVDMLKRGDAEPIWNLSDETEKLLADGRKGAA